MALIYCPECGSRISDKALMCIHCGCPAEYYSEAKPVPVKVVGYAGDDETKSKNRTVVRNGERIPVVRGLKEASKMTGISYDRLRRMALKGEIVHVRCGSKILINMDRLSDFLNGIPVQGGEASGRKDSI